MEESKSNQLFSKKQIESSDNRPAFHIYKEDTLVAEVRGTDPLNQKVIPMHALSDYEENKLFEYAKDIDS